MKKPTMAQVKEFVLESLQQRFEQALTAERYHSRFARASDRNLLLIRTNLGILNDCMQVLTGPAEGDGYDRQVMIIPVILHPAAWSTLLASWSKFLKCDTLMMGCVGLS